MDVLKARPKSLIISFTTCKNKLKLHLASVGNKKVIELYALRSQFKDKFHHLDEVQNEILSLLLEDPMKTDEYEAGFQTAKGYRDNYFIIESRVDYFIKRDIKSYSKASSEENQLKIKSLKIEVTTLSGDPKDFLTFWSIFSKIHEFDNLSAIDKFQYL